MRRAASYEQKDVPLIRGNRSASPFTAFHGVNAEGYVLFESQRRIKRSFAHSRCCFFQIVLQQSTSLTAGNFSRPHQMNGCRLHQSTTRKYCMLPRQAILRRAHAYLNSDIHLRTRWHERVHVLFCRRSYIYWSPQVVDLTHICMHCTHVQKTGEPTVYLSPQIAVDLRRLILRNEGNGRVCCIRRMGVGAIPKGRGVDASLII